MSSVDSRPGLGIWERRFSRRNGMIIASAAVGTAIGTLISNDYFQGREEFYSQYGDLSRVEDDLVFLERENIIVPPDRLFGYTFPSTPEMVEKYRQLTLETSVVVVYEKEPTYLSRRVMQALGMEVGRSYNPNVVKGKERTFIVLPPSYIHDPEHERAAILYHEGIHAFYQDKVEMSLYEQESMANIAEVLLFAEMRQRGIISKTMFGIMDLAYLISLQSGDKSVWERKLKQGYGFDE